MSFKLSVTLESCLDFQRFGTSLVEFLTVNELFYPLKAVSKSVSKTLDKYLSSPKFVFCLHATTFSVPRSSLLLIDRVLPPASSVFDATTVFIAFNIGEYRKIEESESDSHKGIVTEMHGRLKLVTKKKKTSSDSKAAATTSASAPITSTTPDSDEEGTDHNSAIAPSAFLREVRGGSKQLAVARMWLRSNWRLFRVFRSWKSPLEDASSVGSIVLEPRSVDALFDAAHSRVAVLDLASKAIPQIKVDILLQMAKMLSPKRLFGLKCGLHIGDTPLCRLTPAWLRDDFMQKYRGLRFARFLGGHKTDCRHLLRASALFGLLAECRSLLHLDLWCYLLHCGLLKALDLAKSKAMAKSESMAALTYTDSKTAKDASSTEPMALDLASKKECPFPESLVSVCFGFYFDVKMPLEIEASVFGAVATQLVNLEGVRMIVNLRMFANCLRLFGRFLAAPNVKHIIFDVSNAGLRFFALRDLLHGAVIAETWAPLKLDCEDKEFWLLLEETQMKAMCEPMARYFPVWMADAFGVTSERVRKRIAANTHVCVDSSSDWPRPEKLMFAHSPMAARLFHYFDLYGM